MIIIIAILLLILVLSTPVAAQLLGKLIGWAITFGTALFALAVIFVIAVMLFG